MTKKCKVCGVNPATAYGRCEGCRDLQEWKGSCKTCGAPISIGPKSPQLECPTCRYERYNGELTHEPCHECKNVRMVAIRLGDGSPICKMCRKDIYADKGVCPDCNEEDYLKYDPRLKKALCVKCIKKGIQALKKHCHTCGEPQFYNAEGRCTHCEYKRYSTCVNCGKVGIKANGRCRICLENARFGPARLPDNYFDRK